MLPHSTDPEPSAEHLPEPYVGPQPFGEQDAAFFFGRTWEKFELASLVVAHRELVLHAQSAVGKSSLLRAGVFPLLRERGFELLPPARVSGQIGDVDPESIDNIFAYHALSKWQMAPGERSRHATLTLNEYFQARPIDENSSRLRVIFIDQFEELFVAYPERWEERRAFLKQLADALESDPRLRLLVAIRDEFIAPLRDHADLFPESLQAWFHLERLKPENALEAIKDPVERLGYAYEEQAAEAIRDRLLKLTIDRPGGGYSTTTGQYVDPLHLQLVCSRIWQGRKADEKTIAVSDVDKLGDVEEALIDHYLASVRFVSKSVGISERKIRRWFERELVTPLGTRGSVLVTDKAAGSLPKKAMEKLLEKYLVRIEPRAGADWLEISHDRLVRAIRESARRSQARRRPWQYAGAAVAVLAVVVTVLLLNRRAEDAANATAIAAARRTADVAIDAQDPQEHLRPLLQAVAATSEVSGQTDDTRLLDALRLAVNSRRLRWRVDGRILGAAFTDDGKRFTAVDANGVGQTLDLGSVGSSDGPAIQKFPVWSETAEAIAFGADADTGAVAFRGDGNVRVKLVALFPNVSTPNDTRPLNAKTLDAIAVRRDRTAPSQTTVQVAVADQRSITHWSTGATGRLVTMDHGLTTLKALAWSGDGARYAGVGQMNGTAEGRIWRRGVRVPQFRMSTRDRELTAVAFGPDNRMVATGSSEGALTIWSEPAVPDTVKNVDGVVLDRQGSPCAGAQVTAQSVNGSDVTALSQDNGRYVLEGVQQGPQRITVVWYGSGEATKDANGKDTFSCGSKSGNTMLIAQTTRTLTIRTNRNVGFRLSPRVRGESEEAEVRSEPAALYPTLVLRGHTGPITGLQFQGASRVVTVGADRTVRIWNLTSGREVETLRGHENDLQSVLASAQHSWIASIDAQGALGWDSSIGGTVIRGGLERNRVSFSPSGTSVVAVGPAERVDRTRSSTRSFTAFPVASPDKPVATGKIPGSASEAAVDDTGRQIALISSTKQLLVQGSTPDVGSRVISRSQGLLAVAISRDGRFAATGGWDGTITLWNAANASLLATRASEQGHVWKLAFTPDGGTLASAGQDGTIRMWNAQSLAPVQTIQNDPGQRRGSVSLAGGRDVRGFAFDRTGELFASASWDNTIKLWRRSGTLVHTFERQAKPVNAVAFSPTMPRLVSGGSDGLVRIWDTATFQPVASFQHKRSVRDVQFSPDGRSVLVSDTSRTATVWNVATNRSTVLDGHDSTIWTASYDSSGTGVVTASKDGTARVWNARDPRGAIALRGHTGSVNEAIFTPDGARVVTVGDDGSWRSWDRKTGQSLAVVGGFAGIQLTSIAVSPNGTQVLGIDVAGAPRMLDVGTRSVISGAVGTLPGGNIFVRGIWRPDGRQIALLTGEGQIFLVSPEAGGANAAVRLERPTAVVATDVAYSSNSERLAVADKTGEIGLWNVREGPTFVAAMLGARSNVQSLAVSSNGAFVAAVTTDSRLRVWNTRTGVPLLSQPVDVNTQAMRFDPNDALVTAWDDGTVRRYLVAPLLEPSTAAVVSEGLRRFGTPMSWAAAQEIRGDALGALTGDVRRAIESALSDREAPRTPPAQ